MAQAIPLVIAIGVSILSAALRPKQQSRPTPEDKLTSSDMGVGIDCGWGTRVHKPFLPWQGERQEEEADSGGKGVGGGASYWIYKQSFAYGCCAGRTGDQGQQVLTLYENESKVIYDATDANAGVHGRNVNLTWYPGSNSQLPDPTIEAAEGVGHTPAMRGLGYFVLKLLDTTEIGGHTPSFKAIVSDSAALEEPTPTEVLLADLDPALTWISDIRSDNNGYLYGLCNLGFIKINAESDTLVAAGYPYATVDITDWDIDESGNIYVIHTDRVAKIDSDTMTELAYSSTTGWDRIQATGDFVVLAGSTTSAGGTTIRCYDSTMTQVWEESGIGGGSDLVGMGMNWVAFRSYLDGELTFYELDIVMNNPGVMTRILWQEGLIDLTVVEHAWDEVDSVAVYYDDNNTELAVISSDESVAFWDLDEDKWLVNSSIVNQGDTALSRFPYQDTIWLMRYESSGYQLNRVNLTNRTNVRSFDGWEGHVVCYEPNTQAMYTESSECGTPTSAADECIGKYILRAAAGAPVNVSDVLTDLCMMVPLIAYLVGEGELTIDASSVTDVMTGFVHEGGTDPASSIQTLCQAYLIDIVENGTVLEFHKRYPTTPWTPIEVDWDDLGAREEGESRTTPRLIHNIIEEDRLPYKVTVKTLDPDEKYEVATDPPAVHPFTNSGYEKTYSFTQIVADRTERGIMAMQLLQEEWLNRHQFEGSLPQKYYYINPGDILHVQPPGEEWYIRVIKVDLGVPGLVRWKGCRTVIRNVGIDEFTVLLGTTEALPTCNYDYNNQRLEGGLYALEVDGETIDGAEGNPGVNDRVLVKDQENQVRNGIYRVEQIGSEGVSDFLSWSETSRYALGGSDSRIALAWANESGAMRIFTSTYRGTGLYTRRMFSVTAEYLHNLLGDFDEVDQPGSVMGTTTLAPCMFPDNLTACELYRKEYWTGYTYATKPYIMRFDGAAYSEEVYAVCSGEVTMDDEIYQAGLNSVAGFAYLRGTAGTVNLSRLTYPYMGDGSDALVALYNAGYAGHSLSPRYLFNSPAREMDLSFVYGWATESVINKARLFTINGTNLDAIPHTAGVLGGAALDAVKIGDYLYVLHTLGSPTGIALTKVHVTSGASTYLGRCQTAAGAEIPAVSGCHMFYNSDIYIVATNNALGAYRLEFWKVDSDVITNVFEGTFTGNCYLPRIIYGDSEKMVMHLINDNDSVILVSENGGTPPATWRLKRSDDFDRGTTFVNKPLVNVTGGVTNADTYWGMTDHFGRVVDDDELAFEQEEAPE